MHADSRFWLWTSVAAGFAVALAAMGLGLRAFAVTSPPFIDSLLLAGSLISTGTALYRLAGRVRHLERSNEGLVEELSQEFNKVRERLDAFSDAVQAARVLTAEQTEDEAAVRRVVAK